MSDNEKNVVEEEEELEGEEGEEEQEGGGKRQPKEPRGPRPSATVAMRAKCFDCCGDMIDGRVDCQIVKCPLYYWQPYRRLTPDLSWQEDGSHLSKNRRALRLKKAGAAVDQDTHETEGTEDNDE